MVRGLYARKVYQPMLTKVLGDSPKLRIMDFFMDNPLSDFTGRGAAEALGMSNQTFHEHFKDLKDDGFITASAGAGGAKLYRINKQHPLVGKLEEIVNLMSPKVVKKELMDRGFPHADVLEDEYDSLEYRDFRILVWKRHPASKKADFDSIADSLTDYRQAVIEAAQFMYENESYVHFYGVTIQPQHFDFEINLSFPFVKGRGMEKGLIGKKRIVSVDLKSIKVPTPKDAVYAFAHVADWDLFPFQCFD